MIPRSCHHLIQYFMCGLLFVCECRKKVCALLRLDVPQLLSTCTEEEIFSCKYNTGRGAFICGILCVAPHHQPCWLLAAAPTELCSTSAPFWRTVCPGWMLILLFISHFPSQHLAKFHCDPYPHPFDVLLLLLCLPPVVLLSYFELVSPLQNIDTTIECGLEYCIFKYIMFYLFKWIFPPKCVLTTAT